MALFIGRLPMDCRPRELEDIFVKYGRITRCDVKRGGYGFVEYEDPRDAEDAIKYCDGMRFLGGRIVVEWARGTNRRGGPAGGPSGGPNDECFKCGKTGHWARDCPTTRDRDSRGDRAYDRGRDRDTRDSRDRDRDRDRRDYRGRDRSRSRSPARKPADRSPSPARSRSRSRSPRSKSPARD